MKKRINLLLATCVVGTLCFGATASAADSRAMPAPRIGIVNFKSCVEDSKLGKKERDNFDTMRRQLESSLEGKEKRLQDLSAKFNDPDYVDSLSPEAEENAKKEYRDLSQELAQVQQQYYQMLNQANFKIVQNLAEEVGNASRRVAKDLGLDLILNEESSFFYIEALDISERVIGLMDAAADEQEGQHTS